MRFRFRAHETETNNGKSDLKAISNTDNRPVTFNIIEYDEFHFFEPKINNLSELTTYLTTPSCTSIDLCTWINIEGIHRRDILDELSNQFNIHNLIIEDIYTINERMKLDLLDNGSSIYLLMKMIYIHPDLNHIQQEQISFILKENNFLITFQEAKDKFSSFDIFQIIKYRLKNNRGKIRSLKIDYLFYCLIDVLIENYMMVLDHISVKIDMIDKLLMNKLRQTKNVNISTNNSNFETLKLIYDIKHDMLSFRILCLPLREIVIKLQKAQDRISMKNQKTHSRRQYRRRKRPKHITLSGNYFYNPNSDPLNHHWSPENVQEEVPLFNEYIFLYFKDLDDHIIQLQDRINTYCDLLKSLITFYILLNEADMNVIMRCLTLVSVVFIPLTWTIGLFSLNYHNMPPLYWYYGYFTFLSFLGFSVISMFSFFKWKKWW
jgi:magnesium transporter